MTFEKYYVLDTNIILEDATNIFKLSDNGKNLIVLPETVLDEVDSKKSGFDEINFQARQFARTLENSEIIETKSINNYNFVTLKIVSDTTTYIDVVSTANYNINEKNVSLHILNDRKILQVTEFLKDVYDKEVEFISLDIMARTRAISMNIKTSSLNGSNKDEMEFKFVKHIQIKFEDLERIDNSLITDFDEEYKVNNYCYCFKVKSSDQVLLGMIENKRIQILDEEEIRNQIITPLNKEQLFFSNAIMKHFFNVLIIEAKAGSGKTLLALSGALKLVRQKVFQKIIYIRNSIESLDKGEDVGYLPGLEEKFKIYNHPLMDSLEYIVRSEDKKKSKKNKENYSELDDQEVKSRVENLIANYSIETMWVGEMRGRTLSNSFIIIDEAQNMSNKTMQMVLSRIDNTCKVVILGSNKQIDNFYVNKYTNALTTLLKATNQETTLVNSFAIKLEKVLRGPITEWAENIFNK